MHHRFCALLVAAAFAGTAGSARADNVHVATLLANGVAIDPTATLGLAPSVPCLITNGQTVPAGVCVSFNVPAGMQYLGWISHFGSTALSAEAEMTSGAGPTNAMWVHVNQGNSGVGMFGSEFDVFNNTPASDPHQRNGIIVAGSGNLSNAAVNITKDDTGNDQWVTGIDVSQFSLGPALIDVSGDANVIHIAEGRHQNMLVPNPTLVFPLGIFSGLSDAPSGSVQDIVWRPASAASVTSTWSVGPTDQQGAPCTLCIATPQASATAAAGSADIAVGADGSLATAGTLIRINALGSARHLAMAAASNSSATLTLAPTWTDAQNAAGTGTASLSGTLSCVSPSGASATWRTALIWSLSSGTVLSSSVALLVASQSGAPPSGPGSPTFWTPSFATSAGAIPTISVLQPNGPAPLSCKADEDMLVNTAT